jgi:hypothetical protein
MEPVMMPENPGALAVIGMLEQAAREVRRPLVGHRTLSGVPGVLQTKTASGVELVQVTSFVMSLVVAGWLPWV